MEVAPLIFRDPYYKTFPGSEQQTALQSITLSSCFVPLLLTWKAAETVLFSLNLIHHLHRNADLAVISQFNSVAGTAHNCQVVGISILAGDPLRAVMDVYVKE